MALEIMITVGGSDYYISDEGHSGASFGTTTGSQYYFPFVAKPPRLTWGPTNKGYISVQAGTLSLVNKPYDSNHPFSGTNYRNLLSDAGTTTNLPTIAIKDSTKYAIFDGSLVFNNLNSEVINFSVEGLNYDNYLAEGTVTDSDSDTQVIPWPFGYVNTVPAFVYKGSQVWANGASSTHPGFSKFGLAIFEGNTLAATRYTSGTTACSATEFDGQSATPAYSNGIVHVSGNGTKRSGDVNASLAGDKTSTLGDLLTYISADIGLSYIDTSKTSISTDTLSIWQTEKIQVLDLFSKVCQATNHQFFIARKQSGTGEGEYVMALIDRANNPTANQLLTENIISSSYRILAPLASVTLRMNWVSLAGPETNTLDMVSTNLSYGKQIVYKNYYGTNKVAYGSQARVDAIRDIEKKPIATVVLDGIKDTTKPGDRFTFTRKQDQITVDMLARSITWDWDKRQTTLTGDANLSIYEEI
jgi:hypothetical protein